MDFKLMFENIIELLGKYWQVYLLEGVKNTMILTVIAVLMALGLGDGAFRYPHFVAEGIVNMGGFAAYGLRLHGDGGQNEGIGGAENHSYCHDPDKLPPNTLQTVRPVCPVKIFIYVHHDALLSIFAIDRVI